MKKFATLALAGAMSMATVGSVFAAEALMTKEGNETNAENYIISFEDLTDDEIKSITKIEAEVSVTSNMVNGTIGYNSVSKAAEDGADKAWKTVNQELATSDGEAGPISGTWVLEAEAGDFAVVDEDGAIAPYAEVQFWWVNPLYNEEGEEDGNGIATLTAVTLYDAEGNVLSSVGAQPGDETGDAAPIVYLIAVAAMAGAALAITKKLA